MGLGPITIVHRHLYGRALALAMFGITIAAQAATVVTPKGDVALTVGTAAVPVVAYRSVGLQLDGATALTELHLTGAGNREGLFGLLPYGVVSYISVDPASIAAGEEKSKLLETVRNSETKLLQMTMLMDLSAKQIRNAFKDALRANDVNLNEPAIAGLLEKIAFPFKMGLQVNIIGYAKDAHTQVVRVEVEGREALVAEGENLASNFWKIWFGIPVDDKMGDLQVKLIQQISK